jgi:hypothetical protein
MTEEQATALMDHICASARMVEPAVDDPHYLKAVHDPDDVFILRTAVGAYAEADLAVLTERHIVSGDGRAFPKGRVYYGFRCREAHEFWEEFSGANAGVSA